MYWVGLPSESRFTPKIGASASHASLNGAVASAPDDVRPRPGSGPSVIFKNCAALDPRVLAAEHQERHVHLVVVPRAGDLAEVDDHGVVEQAVAVDVGGRGELLDRL